MEADSPTVCLACHRSGARSSSPTTRPTWPQRRPRGVARGAAEPQGVRVVTIGRTAPTLSPAVASPAKAVAPSGPASAASATASIIAHLRALADPRDELRSALGLAPSGTQAMVVL